MSPSDKRTGPWSEERKANAREKTRQAILLKKATLERFGFRLGDRVRVTHYYNTGKLGTVIDLPFPRRSEWIVVQLDEGGRSLHWHHSYFEHATARDHDGENVVDAKETK